eukprot:4643166-Ditylum_brightwellii.AAC.1
MEVPKVNDTLGMTPPDTSKVSRVEEKDGQESQDNVESDHDGPEVHVKDNDLAHLSLSQMKKETKWRWKWRCRCLKLMKLLKRFHLTLQKGQGLKRKVVKKARTM